MHDTGCLGLVHWDDPEGWDAGMWEGVHNWEHMYTHGGFMSMSTSMAKPLQYCKVIRLQLK